MSATSRDMHPHRYAFCGARALPDLYAGFCMNRGRGAARGDVACRRVMPAKTAGDAILRASLVATSRRGAGWRASHGPVQAAHAESTTPLAISHVRTGQGAGLSLTP